LQPVFGVCYWVVFMGLECGPWSNRQCVCLREGS